MTLSREVKTISELAGAAKWLLDRSRQKKVFAFYGEMGAGKTTFIKALCKQLGVADAAVSPTFALINEYQIEGGPKVFHFDLYRIKDETEVFDFGYEEYFYSGNYCFIEWPEKVEKLLPPGSVKVKIGQEGEKRVILLDN